MQICPNCKSTRIGRLSINHNYGGSGYWGAENGKDAGYTEQDVKSFEDNERPDIECCVCCVCSTCFTPSDAMQDKNGTEIKAGDTLFNSHDRDQYHTVLQGDDGKLYLGDFDSPLERYAPQTWWEVMPNAKLSAGERREEKP